MRSLAQPLLLFSDGVREEHLELKRYLREHLYKHFRVLRMTTKAQRVVLEAREAADGAHIYATDLQPVNSGLQEMRIRLYPFNELLSHRFELGLMIWL